jgi:hypothetical protein
MIVNNELERMCKRSWNNLRYHLPEGTEENYEKLRMVGVLSTSFTSSQKKH